MGKPDDCRQRTIFEFGNAATENNTAGVKDNYSGPGRASVRRFFDDDTAI